MYIQCRLIQISVSSFSRGSSVYTVLQMLFDFMIAWKQPHGLLFSFAVQCAIVYLRDLSLRYETDLVLDDFYPGDDDYRCSMYTSGRLDKIRMFCWLGVCNVFPTSDVLGVSGCKPS